MLEFHVAFRPALAGREPVRRNGVSLEAPAEGTVLHLLAPTAGDDTSRLADDVAEFGLSLRAVSPGQWFAVGPEAAVAAGLQALAGRLGDRAQVVDQSHGRVRIVVRGAMATRVLAKGTAVDLSLATFPVGRSAATLIGHVAAHITRTGGDCFDLLVLRGFAESLWEDLERMSLEFGRADPRGN